MMQIEYYKSILQFKKKFVKSLEPYCPRKREIYKIWAHWLIRNLSQQNVNYHLLSQSLSVDYEVIKHMCQNYISCDRAKLLCQQFSKDYNSLFQQYSEQHQKILSSESDMEYLKNLINCYYLGEHRLYLISMESVPVTLKLTSDKYDYLKNIYTGKPHLFLFYLFELCFNYYMLDGKSLQWSIPQRVFEGLVKFGLKGELFASPVNHYRFNNIVQDYCYYSLFQVDQFFGSSGNFFNLDITEGLYEVNPPFIEEIFTNSSNLLINLLQKNQQPLGFIYIMPDWNDLDGYNLLINSGFYIEQLRLEKGRHSYFQNNNNKYIIASFDTIILIIGNQKFKEKIAIETLLSSIKQNFSINRY